MLMLQNSMDCCSYEIVLVVELADHIFWHLFAVADHADSHNTRWSERRKEKKRHTARNIAILTYILRNLTF